jgi:hypothetical protein
LLIILRKEGRKERRREGKKEGRLSDSESKMLKKI